MTVVEICFAGEARGSSSDDETFATFRFRLESPLELFNLSAGSDSGDKCGPFLFRFG